MIFLIIFGLIFLLVTGTILFAIIKSITIFAQNSNSPLLSSEARVVAKRQGVSSHRHGDHNHLSAIFFVTFEFANRTRQEFRVKGHEFGLLVEGDQGILSNQGTWYKGFQRCL